MYTHINPLLTHTYKNIHTHTYIITYQRQLPAGQLVGEGVPAGKLQYVYVYSVGVKRG